MNTMEAMKEVKEILKKYNPKIKILKASGFMKWYMHFFNAAGICLINKIYIRDDMWDCVDYDMLFHEGVHLQQLKNHGKILYILKYFLWLPFFKTFRWKVEFEANRISFFVCLLDRIVFNTYNPDFNYVEWFINHKLSRVAWCAAPYFYCNIEYKRDYDNWYKKCYNDLIKVEKQALGITKCESEYFQIVKDFMEKIKD